MLSSTRVTRPVATRTLLWLAKEAEGKPGANLLCHVGDCIDNGLIGDDQMARRYPSTCPFIGLDLVGTPRLGFDVRHRQTMSIPDEMIRHGAEVLVNRPLPSVRMPPPLKVVLRPMPALVARDIHAGIVAELELDGVGGDKS